MRLMALEKHFEGHTEGEDEEFEDASGQADRTHENQPPPEYPSPNGFPQNPTFYPTPNGPIFIPPTIPECDE